MQLIWGSTGSREERSWESRTPLSVSKRTTSRSEEEIRGFKGALPAQGSSLSLGSRSSSEGFNPFGETKSLTSLRSCHLQKGNGAAAAPGRSHEASPDLGVGIL
jgi:hypothetical protein